MLPVELTPHTVHHRFRKGKNQWPLIQVGPGVYTVNETSTYKWEQFKPLSISAIELFKEIYPEPGELKLQSLLLRYIDAVPITDDDPGDFFSFLAEKMHTAFAFPASLFESGIQQTPTGIRSTFTFAATKPGGHFNVSISTGKKGDSPAIILDTSMVSGKKEVNTNLYELNVNDWLEASHEICTNAFFAFIQGSLHERFKSDD